MFECNLKIETKYIQVSNGKYLTSFQRKLLLVSLEKSLPESYRQRIEIMLLADEGKSQTEICQILGCCPATARHWMHIARTGMAHQWQDCPIGRPKAVNEKYLERLKELIKSSPRDHGYAFRRWTTNWLGKHLAKEFGIEVSDRHIKRLLKQMGLSTLPKPSNSEANNNEQAKSSKIFISDLKSAAIPDDSEFLSLNFATLGKDSDIYGARYICSVDFSGTVQQYSGLFSFERGISTLSSTS
ncbi:MULTISPECIES: helix-turn-helix domain-containing protein [unclassified Nostoc]|uniref:helix-turn-helix domain-containing protein n=1 Tax=unclassified Nostoc TaxID=2593658 RepID=UPI002AD4035E|nr:MULTISPECIES: helix-turn-helix domain-containing protein [unclassified Nostoc]MDZ8126258.1 helix-turn-helix domain-containing protein [Nostoc sp. CmiVER01]MDZ8227304.1 helix-turn-helix domain-containing protein [Nostoc sp. ChiVER01]